jgi:metal-sulfur cluster biosynthetic enzyme
MGTRLVQIRRAGAGLPVPGPSADPTADAGYQSVPEWDTPPADLEERVWRALYEVPDPEFPISLVDLGLVYGVEVCGPDENGEARVRVAITLTATACPCVEFIKWDVRDRLLEEPGVTDVEVQITWDPPWTTDMITDRGREALRRAGVSI